MDFNTSDVALKQNIRIVNFLKENGKDDLINEIVRGLISERPRISSKFFYDDRGSALFERITALKEYYPTRTEKSIIREFAVDILKGNTVEDIIELGSGDCSKISLLLEGIQTKDLSKYRYVPVDVSKAAILQSANELALKFQELRIDGYVLDFTTHIDQLEKRNPALFCFFGGTIGNFDRADGLNLLSEIRSIMSEDDILLLGFDMIKDPALLNAAYNDSLGITAEFNVNILNVVNSIIGSDFDTADFEHFAFFNSHESRIEMHLIAKRDLTLNSPYLSDNLLIKQGSRIHTENSYKFSPEMIEQLAYGAGLVISNNYSDNNNSFSLVEMRRARARSQEPGVVLKLSSRELAKDLSA
ncbi:MAG: L-histidine N(alpha)-methyltransferase [Bacteroidales bacterium]|nr:L-histidine N(alpha)-methyltransferase [Bacteroidales bacterium]